jgi:hypothetical protein
VENVFEGVTRATGDVPPVGKIYVVPETTTVLPATNVCPSSTNPEPWDSVEIGIPSEGGLVSMRGAVAPIGSTYVVPDAVSVLPGIRVFPLMMTPREGRLLLVPDIDAAAPTVGKGSDVSVLPDVRVFPLMKLLMMPPREGILLVVPEIGIATPVVGGGSEEA